MTAEQWDVHYHRIRAELKEIGFLAGEASEIADARTTLEFGPRPDVDCGGCDQPLGRSASRYWHWLSRWFGRQR